MSEPQPASLNQHTIGFIGSGNMANALIRGLIAHGHQPDSVIASDPDPLKRQALVDQFGIQVTGDNAELVSAANVLFFAVKPQVLHQVVQPLQTVMRQYQPLLVSIAAGVRTQTFHTWLGCDLALVRSMPNTPACLQVGATGLYATFQVDSQQKQLVEEIFASVGTTQWFAHEDDLDTVTALSGSGPAYFFLMLEAMEQAAQQLGLDAQAARQLSAHTALGAARMVLESKESPAKLRVQVTSPGGTTERAIQIMQQHKLGAIVIEAVKAACERAATLSQG